MTLTDRRGFLRSGGLVLGGGVASATALARLASAAGLAAPAAATKADYSLRIEACNL